jgi:predicted nucleic acid-binding protein
MPGRPVLAINVINLGEVFYVVGRRRGERAAREALQDVRITGVVVVPSPEKLVLDAASLKMRHAISYADAFAAATVANGGGYLVTGDQELRTVGGLRILWIGEDSTDGRRGRKDGLK